MLKWTEIFTLRWVIWENGARLTLIGCGTWLIVKAECNNHIENLSYFENNVTGHGKVDEVLLKQLFLLDDSRGGGGWVVKMNSKIVAATV